MNGRRSRLPLGVQTLREVRESGPYYVDKTAYAHELISEGKCYFLSRPRRFGKSLFIDTLRELFTGTEELFKGLSVHDRWDWSVSRPVIRLSFGRGDFTEPDAVKFSALSQVSAVQRRAGIEPDHAGEPAAESFALLLEEMHRRSGRRVVVLVDEYDKPILDALAVSDVARRNRNFLRGFYAAIKDADAHVRFVFLAGVSKFSKVSLFSGLNNLIDITLDPAYSAICGFTETDLDRVFAAELEGLDRDRVQEWYNGYSWLGPEKVYNPYDVLMLLHERRFRAHWFETGSPKFLVDTLMERGVASLSLVQTVDEDELLSSFDVDHIGTEALLFQTGYVTITDIHDDDGDVSYRVDYPNREVRQSLNKALLRRLVSTKAARSAKRTRLLKLLQDVDAEGLRELFEAFFAGVPCQWHTRGEIARYEAYYASVFYSYFTACGFDVAVEDSTSRGRVDMTVRIPERICLFEFKVVDTRLSPPGSAMAQLKNRRYADKYRAEGVPISLIAVEFSREARNVVSLTATNDP